MAFTEDRLDQYENYALFANLALRVLSRLESSRISQGSDDADGASLPLLAKTLEGSSKGASRVSELDADLDRERSPQSEINDYLLLQELFPEKSPHELRDWARDAGERLTEIHDRRWSRVASTRKAWIDDQLKPFLQNLTGLQTPEGHTLTEEGEREAVEF